MIFPFSLSQLQHGETISKICGQNLTQLSAKPITAEGNKMIVIFRTSDFNPEFHQHTGFLANYKKIGPFQIYAFSYVIDTIMMYKNTPKMT